MHVSGYKLRHVGLSRQTWGEGQSSVSGGGDTSKVTPQGRARKWQRDVSRLPDALRLAWNSNSGIYVVGAQHPR